MTEYERLGAWWFAVAVGAAVWLWLLMPAHAMVEWDFTPTGVVSCDEPCKLTGLPVAILVLDGPDSAGAAFFDGYHTPVLTGDPFYFSLAGEAHAAGREFISNTEPIGLGCAYCASGDDGLPWDIVDYSLSWREVGGVLDAVLISFLTEQDEVWKLGLAGGELATDFFLGGCSDVCDVTGVWNDASSPATEPGTLALLAGWLAAFGLQRRRTAAFCGIRRANSTERL